MVISAAPVLNLRSNVKNVVGIKRVGQVETDLFTWLRRLNGELEFAQLTLLSSLSP
jgi:hypothetical protein